MFAYAFLQHIVTFVLAFQFSMSTVRMFIIIIQYSLSIIHIFCFDMLISVECS